MNKRSLLLLIIFIIVVGGILYVYQEYNRTNVSLTETEAATASTAEDLLKSFTTNDTLANTQYLGKVIAVKGTVKNIDSSSGYIIILGDHASMSSVRCAMDSSFDIKSHPVAINNAITIKGICTGFNADELLGSDVILNRCVVSSGK